MAGGAAGRHEDLESALRLSRDRVLIAFEVAIEGRRRPKRALVFGDRVGDILFRDAILVERGKLRDEGLILLKALDDLRPKRAHLYRVLDRAKRLLCERGGAAIPELHEVQVRVEDGGRVDRAKLAVDAG